MQNKKPEVRKLRSRANVKTAAAKSFQTVVEPTV
jgi:hypothetical protein